MLSFSDAIAVRTVALWQAWCGFARGRGDGQDSTSRQRVLSAAGSCALVLALAVQYWPLLRPRRKALPPGSSGLPLLVGHSLRLLGDVGAWLRSMHAEYGPAFRCMAFGTHVVIVDVDVYERALSKLDSTCQFVPLWPGGFQKLLGSNALQFLDGGSGARGARHRRLKRKVLDALTPAELRKFMPRVEEIIRQEFDQMVAETAAEGQTALMPHAMRMVKQVILELILGPGGIRPEEYLKDTSKILLDGMIAAPVDLGPLSAFGKAMKVRRDYQGDVDRLLSSAFRSTESKPKQDPRNAASPGSPTTRTLLSRVVEDCEHGAGLSLAEMQDMLVSLLFGGSLTTAETMQWLLVELMRNPEWRAQVRDEQQQLGGLAAASGGRLVDAWGTAPPEGSRSPCPRSLGACYETLRLHCPIDVQLRAVEEDVDLGEGCGTVPAGWSVGVHLTERGLRRGTHFDPGYWEGRAANSEVTAFGLGPHFCVGRQLALWELQVFLHVWLTSYDVEVISEETYCLTGLKRFKGGLPIRVGRKLTPERAAGA